MDYAVLSTMKLNTPKRTTLSYDIACQWSINLWDRIKTYGERWTPWQNRTWFKFFVPKFHLPAHILKCHFPWGFNWAPGVGRVDGEAIERNWATTNAVASSTKEMGPGAFMDTLDDHFGDHNYRKTMVLGMMFSSFSSLV